MTDWDDRRYFLALARETSIRKAARTLGVSRSTVLRRVSSFEDSLGVRLFERLPDGYFTTPAGDEMLQSAIRIETETTATDRRLAGRDEQPGGRLRVTLPGAMATHLLMPDLAAFARAHPAIRLEILPTYAPTDMARREADVAIRPTNNPPEDLVGRRVAAVARAAYVCAGYLPGSAPDTPLPGWIGWSDKPSSLQWVRDSDFPDLPVCAVVNDPHATMEAVREGLGMAILPCFMGDTAPDLRRMPPGTLQPAQDLWVLTHEDLRKTARIRIFTAFMTEAILRHRDLLEGRRAGAP